MSRLTTSAERIAETASLHAFVNAYLREIHAGTWYDPGEFASVHGLAFESGETCVVVLDLEASEQSIALGVWLRSRVARHSFTSVHRRWNRHGEWRPVDGLSVELALLEEIFANSPRTSARLDMLSRVLESHQAMTRYVEGRLARGQREAHGFITSEQAAVFGHWLHPSPKSRQGFLSYHHEHYAPELAGRFQLHFFAAERSLCEHLSMTGEGADELARGLAQRGPEGRAFERCVAPLGDGYCLLPIHPLQAQWLLHQNYVRKLLDEGRLIDLGLLGPDFTATSSVRSIYCETEAYMLKVSIPVKITNSLRVNLRNELGDGVWLSELFRRCQLAVEFPRLRIIDDPAYITLALPDKVETGFEVVFRRNPFRVDSVGTTGAEVHAILALTQDPLDSEHTSLLADVVSRHALDADLELEEAAVRWFDAYWDCAVAPVIGVYDRYGIALEAHQQNVLVELEPSGLPRTSYYRDTQGVGISESFRERHIAMVPELENQTKVFEPDEIVRSGLGYYLIYNQLFAVIYRLAADGLATESALLEICHRRLRALRTSMRGLGLPFVDGLLHTSTHPFKGNLLTRIADVDELEAENELGVYIQVENPLATAVERPIESVGNGRVTRLTGESV
jgi:siderophore synthetase component